MGGFAEQLEVFAERGGAELLGPLTRSHGAEGGHRARAPRPPGPAVLPRSPRSVSAKVSSMAMSRPREGGWSWDFF